MVEPIIFKITEAGKRSAFDATTDLAELRVNLTHVAIGSAYYEVLGNETSLQSEFDRQPIVSGDVEPASNTLRFSSTLGSEQITQVYEMGVFTDKNVLFAIAVASSPSKPLFTIYPLIKFATSFGLSLDDMDSENITVVNDPNGALALIIMENHLAAPDPHPQYLTKARFQLLLSAAFPFGYKYWSSVPEDPSAIFDELMGIKTYWRRLEGVQLVGVKDDDPVISQYGLVAGNGKLDRTNNAKPKEFTHYTSYLWERYDPNAAIRHNGISRRNGIHKFK